jgi:hypothetical protein
MRSRDRIDERILRAVAILALAGWVALMLRPSPSGRQVANESTLRDALTRWTRSGRVDSVHVQLDTVPDATNIAWLAALRGAAVRVSWAASEIPAVALETYPAADPAGGTIVLASAPGVLSDDLGPLDTVPPHASASRVAIVEGSLALTSGRQSARADVSLGSAPRRVFVSGSAGWEAKFIIGALEDRGWSVDARIAVLPGQDVRQGPRAPLDTARYAAVILLDSAAAESIGGVERFVRDGGGLVLAGSANAARRIAPLVAWRVRAREAAPLGTSASDSAWRGLSRLPFDTLPDRRAVAVERRNGKLLVAARRYYAGRVMGVGYDQTWRWRMMGGDNGLAEHGALWSRLVASAISQPYLASRRLTTGSAPLVALHAALGAPTAVAHARPPALPASAPTHALAGLALASLLAEWLLRRSRGAR